MGVTLMTFSKIYRLTLLLFFFLFSFTPVEYRDISANVHQNQGILYLSKAEAEKMANDTRNNLLVDVRNHAEYLQFHLDHAINIPMSELNEHLNELEPYKEKNIIIYCQKGTRSKYVAQQLNSLGYKHLYVIMNGVN